MPFTCMLRLYASAIYIYGMVLESPKMRILFIRFKRDLLSKMKFLNNRLYHFDRANAYAITAYFVALCVHYRDAQRYKKVIKIQIKCIAQKLNQNKQWVHTHTYKRNIDENKNNHRYHAIGFLCYAIPKCYYTQFNFTIIMPVIHLWKWKLNVFLLRPLSHTRLLCLLLWRFYNISFGTR